MAAPLLRRGNYYLVLTDIYACVCCQRMTGMLAKRLLCIAFRTCQLWQQLTKQQANQPNVQYMEAGCACACTLLSLLCIHNIKFYAIELVCIAMQQINSTQPNWSEAKWTSLNCWHKCMLGCSLNVVNKSLHNFPLSRTIILLSIGEDFIHKFWNLKE